MQDLENILAKFEKIVSPDFCHCLAKKVNFIQRSSSKIKGYEFARAMMIPNAFIEAETLNSLSIRMRTINKECEISAAALAQRMNQVSAVAFMKSCFGKVLKEITQEEFTGLSDIKNLNLFNRVLIQDSTMAELNEKLSPYFKGRGGAASKAALKIDFIFDYLSEQIIDIDFFSGNKADTTLAHRINSVIQENDLVIRDLGYYALKRIQEIEVASAFYISRFKSTITIYETKDAPQPLDLADFLDKNSKQGQFDGQLFIGEEKHPVRVIACHLSEEAINKRRRDANRTAQRSGIETSKKKLNLLKYLIFITNVKEDVLPATAVMASYRARWRAELIFKQWKSCLKIHYFKGYRKERIECLIYARLIMMLLIGAMAPCLMRYALILGRELSCFKFINYLIADHAFATALIKGSITQFVDQLARDIKRRLCKDVRQRHTLRSNVKLGQSYYKEPINDDLLVKIA